MNKYIVISNEGCYAEDVLQQLPNYKGIDRVSWPLCNEDLAKIQNLPEKEKMSAELCIEKMGGIHAKDIDFYCNDFFYTYQYARLCNMLGINADIFLCRTCFDEDIQDESLEIDKYLFLGYDYAMKEAGYSCLVWEKYLIDKIERISLNENGLLNNFEDAKKFAALREMAKEKNGGMGFEKGCDGVDFCIIALYKYDVDSLYL